MNFEYICFLITNKCNLQCNYCYRMDSAIDFMPFDNFQKYLQIIKNLGYNIILSTNSLLLNIDDLSLRDVDGLVISLDGSRQEIDAIHRGKEHFDKTIKIIDQYRKNTYPFKLKVNTVMTKSNYDDLEKMALLLNDDKIYWRIFFCKTKGSYNHIEKRELIDKENFLKKNKRT